MNLRFDRPWKRFLRRWAILLGGGYLAVCTLLWLLENRMVFHPTPETEFWEIAPVATIEDVSFTSPNGTKLHAWFLQREPTDPVVLMCNGNAGNLSGRGQNLLRIRDRLQASAFIFDYPGYGKSEGKPGEANFYDAAEGAIRCLREVKGVPSERIILYGESIGGGVASEMASRHPVRALILLKSFTSLPATAKKHYPWLPVHWLMRNRFDTHSKLPSIRCPIFIIGATADRVVPFEQSEANFRIANEPKAFFRDEGSDHNDPLPDRFWDELKAFLDRIPKN